MSFGGNMTRRQKSNKNSKKEERVLKKIKSKLKE
jgi:hypothetical protein